MFVRPPCDWDCHLVLRVTGPKSGYLWRVNSTDCLSVASPKNSQLDAGAEQAVRNLSQCFLDDSMCLRTEPFAFCDTTLQSGTIAK